MKRLVKGLKRIIVLIAFVQIISLAAPSISPVFQMVEVAQAATVKINKTKQKLYVGGKVTLKITGTTKAVTWKSSDKSIAAVSSKGVVTAKKKGTATITATVNKKKYKCTITVKNPYIDPLEVALNVDETKALTMTGVSSNAEIVWKSKNPLIAKVSKKGIVTGLAQGTTTITATINQNTYSRKVTVKDNEIQQDREAYSVTYSDKGNKVISGIKLPEGSYTITLTHDGKSDFMVMAYIDGVKEEWPAVDEIGICAIKTILNGGRRFSTDDLKLEVNADGNWTIKIETIGSQETINVHGRGKSVSGYFEGNNKTNLVTFAHDRGAVFIVYLMSMEGKVVYFDYGFGSFTVEEEIKLEEGKLYFWIVEANGKWSINIDGETQSTDISVAGPEGVSEEVNNSDFFWGVNGEKYEIEPRVAEKLESGLPQGEAYTTPEGHSSPENIMFEIALPSSIISRGVGLIVYNLGDKPIEILEENFIMDTTGQKVVLGVSVDDAGVVLETPTVIEPENMDVVVYVTERYVYTDEFLMIGFDFIYDGIKYRGIITSWGFYAYIPFT